MPNNYRGKATKITWGAGFANTLWLGYQLDNAITYPLPRDGSEQTQYRSGVEDAWDAGTDQCLDASLRYIPRDDGTSREGLTVTGWNGATGVAAFLSWARSKNVFRLYPDYNGAPATFFSFYLVEPMGNDGIELEDDFTRRAHLVARTSDGTAVDGY